MITDSLLIRHIAGETEAAEDSEILQWLKSDTRNEEYYKTLVSLYNNPQDVISADDMEKDWVKTREAMLANPVALVDSQKNYLKWALRAAAIIILALGTSLIFNLRNGDHHIKGKSEEPIASILPDGSEVFLSKGSRLSYSRHFDNELREVSLSGEAFFTVTADTERPFIVHTGEAKVRVTGTSFLVSAPVRNEDVEVVVRSGKVLFYNSETFSENSFKVGLGPGGKGIYSAKLNQMNKTRVDNTNS